MQRTQKFVTLTLSAVVVMTVGVAHSGALHSKVIAGATLVDGSGRAPVRDAVVVIEGTRISQVGSKDEVEFPPGARVIDAGGKFIIPGLADMHNHLGDGSFLIEKTRPDFARSLGEVLAWGFTTVFDPGILDLESFAELKRLAADESAPYPHFFGVGRILSAKGDGGDGYQIETEEEARAAVREQKAAGVDAIKFYYNDSTFVTTEATPMLPPSVMAAIIDEAHKHGLRAYAHAVFLENGKEVLLAGGDGFVHDIISDPVDDEFISLMKRNRARYITTFGIYQAAADIAAWTRLARRFDHNGLISQDVYQVGLDPATIRQWASMFDKLSYLKACLPVMRANSKKLFDAGIPVVTGSGTTTTGGPGTVLGLAGQMELMLLVEAGYRPEEVLRISTIDAARFLGREKDQGSIEPGKLADLVILEADPLEDIRNIRSVHRVIKGGVIHDPAELRRSSSSRKR